ncbi:MAG TPA: zinc-ribbon domain-containing protein [Candidatus Bathyarchaeia archaeon]|nr:zinc-ribbon domain-containing protein [Candidatus Bathyarchaeia archaeon]
MRVSSWVATILLLLSIVAMATNANTSGYFAPESSPQSGFLCTFTSTLSPSTITYGTPSVTVSGTDTCNPPESYLWAALLPGNPKLVDYLSDPCDSIEAAINGGRYSPSTNPSQFGSYLWEYSDFYGYSAVQNFALTDSSGQFSGNYPTSPLAPSIFGWKSGAPPSLKPGGYCIILQVPCPQESGTYIPPLTGFTPGCQAPVYDNLVVVESSSPSTSTSTSFTPFCFTCYTFSSSSPTCSAFLCSFASISQPAVTNTLPPAAVLQTDWAMSSVQITPPNPQVGDPVTLSAVLVALSSTASFPQSVDVECAIDGMSCGGGTVSYPGPAGNPATVSAQVPWIATPGIHTLTWSVSTNNDPNPSNNVMSITFAVGSVQTSQTTQISTLTQSASDFMIEVSPASQSVVQGQTVSYSVNVVSLNGFNSQVSLSVSGLPSDANGVFSNPSGTPNFASTLTVTLPENVSTGSYTLTVTGSGGGLSHVANLVLTVNAAMVTQTSISSTQTSSDLMSMIQQNQLLILGGIVLIVVLAVAVALMSRRKPTQPTSGATSGMIYCRSCGTQNPTANEFCGKCGTKLH